MSAQRKVDPEAFFAQNSVFTLETWAASQGKEGALAAARDQLKHHLKRARVRSLSRGLYLSVPHGVDPAATKPDTYLCAVAKCADAVFCYHAALELLGTAHSTWHECTVFCEPRRKPLALPDATVRFLAPPVPLRRRQLEELGIVSVSWQGKPLKVTGRERTLVEGFREPRYVGGLEELVESAGGFGVLDLELLRRMLDAYAEKNLWALLGWFLDLHRQRFQPPASLLDLCEAKRPAKPVNIPRSQRGGRLLPRWNLVLPESLLRSFEGNPQ